MAIVLDFVTANIADDLNVRRIRLERQVERLALRHPLLIGSRRVFLLGNKKACALVVVIRIGEERGSGATRLCLTESLGGGLDDDLGVEVDCYLVAVFDLRARGGTL